MRRRWYIDDKINKDIDIAVDEAYRYKVVVRALLHGLLPQPPHVAQRFVGSYIDGPIEPALWEIRYNLTPMAATKLSLEREKRFSTHK